MVNGERWRDRKRQKMKTLDGKMKSKGQKSDSGDDCKRGERKTEEEREERDMRE